MTKFLTTAAFIAGAFAATAATAATYKHTAEANRNGVENATFVYNSNEETFKMRFTSKDSDNADGFWVVVNDGPQPYGQGQGHLAILYSDLTDVWAFQYTGAGVRGVNASYNNSFLGKFDDAISSASDGAGKTTYSMKIDVSGINSAGLPSTTTPALPWEGVKFDSKIGTWLHTTQNTFASCGSSYETDGRLSCFKGNDWLGWDESNRMTTVVPLPAGLPLMLAGLGAFGLARRFKKT